jgi:hypothetical protein
MGQYDGAAGIKFSVFAWRPPFWLAFCPSSATSSQYAAVPLLSAAFASATVLLPADFFAAVFFFAL